ncbi:MAG: DUF4296 domain-containing protein [Culturomica sp.]|nr:DUF4296 domain-containing protein [Culturomica sp.]
MKHNILIISLLIILIGCSTGKPILDEKRFTSLLIDIHTVDAEMTTLGSTIDKNKNAYTYYNWIYDKYGITSAQFDTCIYYYTSRPELYLRIYETVLDTLNMRLTYQNQELSKLRADDSVNYFTVQDSIFLTKDTLSRTFTVDSLQSGLYTFSVFIKFNQKDDGKDNRITSRFISADNKDTLNVRTLNVPQDTIRSKKYTWSQYVDSVYSRLEVEILKADNMKAIKSRDVVITDLNLIKPYISNKKREQQEQLLKSEERRQGKTVQTEKLDVANPALELEPPVSMHEEHEMLQPVLKKKLPITKEKEKEKAKKID